MMFNLLKLYYNDIDCEPLCDNWVIVYICLHLNEN